MNSADSGNDTDADDNEALDEENPQNENAVTENTTNTADSTGEAFLCRISALTAAEAQVSDPEPPSNTKSGRKLVKHPTMSFTNCKSHIVFLHYLSILVRAINLFHYN